MKRPVMSTRAVIKYIKWMGVGVPSGVIYIKPMRHLYSRGAADCNGWDRIRISRTSFVDMPEMYSRVLMWHEVGHLMTCGMTHTEDEVYCQLWMMRELKVRGFTRMYQYEVDEMREWLHMPRKRMNTYMRYRKAARIVLKELGEPRRKPKENACQMKSVNQKIKKNLNRALSAAAKLNS